jgi:hypothetical protein
MSGCLLSQQASTASFLTGGHCEAAFMPLRKRAWFVLFSIDRAAAIQPGLRISQD